MNNRKLFHRRTVMKKNAFVLFLACCLFLSLPAQALVTVTPANTEIESYPIPEAPDGPGGEHLIFSFDLVVSDPDGASASGFQSTLGVDPLVGLVFDDDYDDPCDIETARDVAEMVETNINYWLYGVADAFGAAYGCPEGSNEFGFNDYDEEVALHALAAGDIMARYSFIWDGTPGDYTFTLDLDTDYTFLFYDIYTLPGAIAFDPGVEEWVKEGGDDWFTVTLVPEPATLVLLGLGGFMIRKRRA
jgi:hypothetical protein